MRRNDPRDLPEELTLPLPSGAPWWYWLGGRPALDFVNTRRERWNREVETLVTPEDLGAWLVDAGVTTEAPLAIPRVVLREARELREAIDVLIGCVPPGGSTDSAAPDLTTDHPARPRPSVEEAVVLVDRWIARAGIRPALVLGPDGLPALTERGPADSARRALGELALDAAQMLGRASERARIRICASETCSARFYDRSPAGRRRWCSMEGCGNVAKARRHRARKRAT
jgi:predicted RNA-binding Zn ribbon-like protein